MIKKKNKVNIPLILCSLFVAVISCFVCFNFNKADKSSVYADSVEVNYSFNASSWLTLMVYDNTKYSFANSRISFNNVGDTTSFDFYCKNLHVDDDSIASANSYDMVANGYWLNQTYYSTASLVNGNHTSYSLTGEVSSFWLRLVRVGVEERSMVCRVSRSAGFTGNIISINISVEEISDTYAQFGQNFKRLIVVKYLDANDNYISYALPSVPIYTDNFTPRTYYIASVDQLTDSQLYNQGYQQGLSDNQSSIYDSGYKAGQVVGYNAGFSDGAETTDHYTFLNLLSATIDAPFHYFRSLFGFELLGVNLQSFLMSLFTICVVITIINMVRR